MLKMSLIGLKMLLIGGLLLSFSSVGRATEPMTVPIFLKYGMMQQIMMQQMFKAPGRTAVYRLDHSNCNTVNFSSPHLSGVEGLLQVRANVLVKMGTAADDRKCTGSKNWSGRAVVKGKPIIIGTTGQAVQFKVEQAEVFDINGKPLNRGLMAAALEGQLHPLLDQFKVDLKPHLKQLKSVLPFMLPSYSNEQIEQLIASVHLSAIQVRQNGLNLDVQLALDKQSLFKF